VIFSRTSPGAFHGWHIVVVGMVAQAFGVGLVSSYGVLARALATEFQTSMTQISLGMSIFILTSGAVAPVLGPALDRGSVRAIMLTGVATMFGGLLLMARATALWELGAGLGVVSIGISMYGTLPVHVLLINWFVVRRGAALAVAAMGLSASGFVVPTLTAWLLESFGWRSAVMVLGAICAAATFPVIAMWVVRRPDDLGQFPDGRSPDDGGAPAVATAVDPPGTRELFRDRNFWVLALGFGLAFVVPIVHAVHMVPYLLDAGVDLTRAAMAHSSMSVFSLLGKLGAGVVGDRYDKRLTVVAVLAVQACGWLVLLANPGYSVVLVASALIGVGVGGLIPLSPLIMGECFGRDVIGRVSGLAAPFHLPLLLIAAPLVGFVYDTTGSYVPAFMGVVGALVVSALILLLIRFPAPQTEPLTTADDGAHPEPAP